MGRRWGVVGASLSAGLVLCGASTPASAAVDFEGGADFPAGDGSLRVEVFDADLDGVPDQVIGGGPAVEFLEGLGGGAVGPPQPIAPGVEPANGLVTAQFDSSPGRDVAVTDNSFDPSKVTLVRSRGNGAFRQPRSYGAGPGPTQLAVGDFDGDGRKDVAASSFVSDRLAVLFGRGDGTFARRRLLNVGTSTQGIDAGDLNRDGRDDIVADSADDGGGIALAYGRADRTFRKADLDPGIDGYAVEVADVDRDGRQDIAVTHLVSGNDSASVLWRKRKGFTAPTPLPLNADTFPQAIALGDLTGDGLREVAVANAGGDSISVFEQTAGRTFAGPVSFAVDEEPQDLEIAKLDDDQLRDVVTANLVGDSVTILINEL